MIKIFGRHTTPKERNWRKMRIIKRYDPEGTLMLRFPLSRKIEVMKWVMESGLSLKEAHLIINGCEEFDCKVFGKAIELPYIAVDIDKESNKAYNKLPKFVVYFGHGVSMDIKDWDGDLESLPGKPDTITDMALVISDNPNDPKCIACHRE